ncbi:MAG: hypothetical protein J6A05_10100, partial [Oscillospiraceae bacterium]|nr:hypothetical protein [Oscillospiraceae bacterium]
MILPNLHRIAKVTLAFVLAFMLFIRLFIVDVSALSAAPIFGEALVEVFSGLLVGSGMYTAEEVNDMSWAEAEDAINSGISSGSINPLKVVGDITIDGATKQANFIEWLSLVSKTSTSAVITSDAFGTITDTALKNTLQNFVPVTIGNWFMTEVDEEDVIDTPNADLNGYGCMFMQKYEDNGQAKYVIYCDYAYYDAEEKRIYARGDGKLLRYSKDGELLESSIITTNGTETSIGTASKIFIDNNTYYLEMFGDVRNEEGKAVETDDTFTDVVGENEEGDTVTLEDIQSGVSSLDDTTLDYDKFNDDVIVDLLQQILSELDNIPVIENEEANTLAEDFAQELDGSVALELEDINALTLPTGIATVFPFCLPFDFAYGLELL